MLIPASKQDIYSTRPVYTKPGYVYAPSVMKDGNKFKVWTCTAIAGDFIMLKEADDLRKLHQVTAKETLRPNWNDITSFDRDHTCDPSVIKGGDSAYYLYYGGLNSTGSIVTRTRMGVAKSTDGGRTFTRLNKVDIVSDEEYNKTCEPDENGKKPHLCYGIGQPAVARNNAGYYYMVFTWQLSPTDSKLKVIRSKHNDPTFSEYEVVGNISSGLMGAWSIDLAYNPDRNEFMVIGNGGGTSINIRTSIFDGNFNKKVPGDVDEWLKPNTQIEYVAPIGSFLTFYEGVGLLRTAKGYAKWDTIGELESPTFFGASNKCGGGHPCDIRWVRFGKAQSVKFALRHVSVDCRPGESRLAFLGNVHGGGSGYNFSDGPQNWSLCTRSNDSGRYAAFNLASAGCPVNYVGTAHLGGIIATIGGQFQQSNWIFCTQPNMSAIRMKHGSNSCADVNLRQIGILGSVHGGADGYNFKDGPQDWRLCTENAP